MNQTTIIGLIIFCGCLISVAFGFATQSGRVAESHTSANDLESTIAALKAQVEELRAEVDEHHLQIGTVVLGSAEPDYPVAEQLAENTATRSDLRQLEEMTLQNRESIANTMRTANAMQEWTVGHERSHETIQQWIDGQEKVYHEGIQSHVAIIEYINDVRDDLVAVRDYVEYHHPQKPRATETKRAASEVVDPFAN